MKKSLQLVLLSLPITFITSCEIGFDNENRVKSNNTANQNNATFSKAKETKRVKSVLNRNFADSSSAEKNYKKAITLINSGNRVQGVNILQDLVNRFPDYTKAKVTLDKLESPFSLAASIVEKYIEDWINSPSTVPEFTLQEPKFPDLPERPVLQKGEFEKTSDFNLRVRDAQKQYQAEVESVKRSYQQQIEAYNEAVDEYNAKIDWERKSRAEKVPAMRKRYLDTAFAEVLGKPSLQDLKYDADKEVFYGKIISGNNNLTLNVEIPVIMTKAKAFKENITNIKPLVKIDMIDGNIVFSKVSAIHNNENYAMNLMSSEIHPKSNPKVTIDGKVFSTDIFNIKSIKPLKVKQITRDNRQFFIPKI
jgi:hypothetical protein